MQNFDSLIALAENLPDPYRENALELLNKMSTKIEGIGDDDLEWKIPYMRLVQGTTDRSSIPKGTGIGDILIGETKVDTPYPIIPLRMWESRTYWDPDPTSKAILCSSPDAKVGAFGVECRVCPHSKWEEGKASPCSKNKNALAISSDLKEFFTITFSKTGYKVGMELEAMLKKAATFPYNRTYTISNETSATAKNVEVFKVGVPDADKRRTPEALLGFLKELFTQVGSDRKEAVSGFYEMVEARKAQLLLEGKTPEQALGLSAPESEPDKSFSEGDLVEVVEEPKAEAKGKASMVKNYAP